jgi:hypothetical protein
MNRVGIYGQFFYFIEIIDGKGRFNKHVHLMREHQHHFIFFIFFSLTWVSGQLARTSTNLTGPEVNDHVSLQWSSYEQPQGLNLRPQREQTSWFQTLTTVFFIFHFDMNRGGYF